MLNKVSLRDKGISLGELRILALKLIEIIAILSLGLLFTQNILGPIYENYGIPFTGNVWVNWFGAAYIIYVLYTLMFGLFIFKGNNIFKQRLTSMVFWLVFIGSNYVVFIPFVKGENPF